MASRPNEADAPVNRDMPGIAGYGITTIRLVALLTFLIIMLLLHGLWRAVGVRSPWPRRFLGGTAWICGVRCTTCGLAGSGQVLFVANHVSWLDIPVLAGASGCAFVAHDGLAGAPVIGWLATLNNTVFVARGDRMAVQEQIAGVGVALTGDQSLAIFPEATTGDGKTLRPFKPALLKVVDPAPPGVVVQPVVIDYGPDAAAIAWFDSESGLTNAIRVLSRRRLIHAKVRFLDSFDPAGIGDRKTIAAYVRDVIAAALNAGTSPRGTI